MFGIKVYLCKIFFTIIIAFSSVLVKFVKKHQYAIGKSQGINLFETGVVGFDVVCRRTENAKIRKKNKNRVVCMEGNMDESKLVVMCVMVGGCILAVVVWGCCGEGNNDRVENEVVS